MYFCTSIQTHGHVVFEHYLGLKISPFSSPVARVFNHWIVH